MIGHAGIGAVLPPIVISGSVIGGCGASRVSIPAMAGSRGTESVAARMDHHRYEIVSDEGGGAMPDSRGGEVP